MLKLPFCNVHVYDTHVYATTYHHVSKSIPKEISVVVLLDSKWTAGAEYKKKGTGIFCPGVCP